jgi:O-antigen ligase
MLAAHDDRSVLPLIGLAGAALGLAIAAGGLMSFYVVITLVGCGFVLADFRIGVVLLILLMPISGSSTLFPHEMFGVVGLNPVNLLLVGTLLSCAFQALSDGSIRRLVPRPLLWLYLLPILLAGIVGARHIHEVAPALTVAYPAVDFPNVAAYFRDMVVKPLLLVVFALLVRAAVARSAEPPRYLVPAAFSIAAMALVVPVYVVNSGIGLSQLASSDSRQFLSALGLHANDLGRLYASGLALALFMCWEVTDRVLKSLLVIVAGCAAVALVLTFSRGGYLATAVAGLCFLAWRFSVRTVLIAVLVVAVGAIFLPEAVYERLATGHGEGLDAVSAGRVNGLWLPLLPEVLKNPVVGSGLGSILWSDAMRRGGGSTVLLVTHPHNAYLQAALDMGVCGLALMCAYFVHIWRGFRTLVGDPGLSSALRGFYQGAAAALLGMLVADVTDSSLTPRPEQVFLWLAIGMMYGQIERRRQAASTDMAATAAGAA